ncbi:MAG TPA: hypothetical protein VFF30_15555 [Nitrososphaerales archaeon]|nr:hypothetical protein [Nitrososphaerales archaeon]
MTRLSIVMLVALIAFGAVFLFVNPFNLASGYAHFLGLGAANGSPSSSSSNSTVSGTGQQPTFHHHHDSGWSFGGSDDHDSDEYSSG